MQWTKGTLAAIRCGAAYYRDNGLGNYNQFTLVTDADMPCKIVEEKGGNVLVMLESTTLVLADNNAVLPLSVQASY